MVSIYGICLHENLYLKQQGLTRERLHVSDTFSLYIIYFCSNLHCLLSSFSVFNGWPALGRVKPNLEKIEILMNTITTLKTCLRHQENAEEIFQYLM